ASTLPDRREKPGALTPRSWAMEDVLSEAARRFGVPLVSDCYGQSWDGLSSLAPLPLERFLEEVDRRYHVRWEWQDGILLLRSRFAAARRAAEVSHRDLARWLAQVRRDGVVSLDTMAEMVRLSD